MFISMFTYDLFLIANYSLDLGFCSWIKLETLSVGQIFLFSGGFYVMFWVINRASKGLDKDKDRD